MQTQPEAHQVRVLFDALVDLPPTERATQLLALCADADVRRQVERLLLAADVPHAEVPTQITPAQRDAVDENLTLPELSGYQLTNKLGEGGMGVVYQAWQHSLKRVVAVKMIRPHSADDTEMRRRFRIEAEAVARIVHPNILQVYEVGEQHGRLFLAMEYVDGGSLAQRLNKQPQSPVLAAQLTATLALALEHVHQQGVIHRDLKPGNVLLGTTTDGARTRDIVPAVDWVPKLTDFGLAKLLVGDSDQQTRTGAILGTASYMAPEQARPQSKEVCRQTDVYALGAILYECLTGRPPFVGESTADTIRQVIFDEPIAPRRLQPLVPRDLETICLKCLQKEPRLRYATALELSEDLQRFLRHEPILARPTSRIVRCGLWCRRNPHLALASGFAALAVMAIVVQAVRFRAEQYRVNLDLRRALSESERTTAVSIWERGRQLCETGEVGTGMLLIARALSSLPDDQECENLSDALRTELAGWHRQTHTLQNVWDLGVTVTSVAVSPDGHTVAAGCADGTVQLWDLRTGTRGNQISAHPGGVSSVIFLRGGTQIMTCGPDHKIVIWELPSLKPQQEIIGHTGPVLAIDVSSDDRWLLSGSADQTARLWDLSTSTELDRWQHPGAVRTVAFSPDGQRFVTGGDREIEHESVIRGEARLYQTQADRRDPVVLVKEPANLFRRPVRSAAFSTDGKTLVLGDDDWNATFWDVDSGRHFSTSDHGNGQVRAVAFAPQGDIALAGSYDSGLVLLWDVAQLRTNWNRWKANPVLVRGLDPKPSLSPLFHPAPVTSVTFSMEGSQAITACEDGCIRVWKIAPGQSLSVLKHSPKDPAREYPNRDHVVRAVAIDPAARLTATASWDGTVKLWTLPEGQPIGKPLVHPERATGVAFLPDRRTLVTSCADGSVRFWDLETQTLRGKELPHPYPVTSISVDPDGAFLLASGKTGQAQFWQLDQRQPLGNPLIHNSSYLMSDPSRAARPVDIDLAAVSPRKNRLLTGSRKGTALIWDHDGHQLHELLHQNTVMGGAFSHDGQRVATGSDDMTARVWDVESGALQATLIHRSPVNAVTFNHLGNRLLTGSSGEGAQLWDVETQRRVGPNVKFAAEVMHVAICPQGKTAVFADWDGYGLIWSLPQPLPGTPESIESWIQAELGLTLDERDGRQVMDGPTWLTLQQRLKSPRGHAVLGHD